MGNFSASFKWTRSWQMLLAILLTLFLVIGWAATTIFFFEFLDHYRSRINPPWQPFVLFFYMAVYLVVGTIANVCLYKAVFAWKPLINNPTGDELRASLKWQRYFFMALNTFILLLCLGALTVFLLVVFSRRF